MPTLYRKYRPQTFKDIYGQNHIKITLQNEIETGNIAHAYLFCGPRAIGKTTIARIFAKSVNCQNRKDGEHEPCNECEACVNTTAGRNMDIIEIDAASHTGVDNVRENIISSARIAPSKNRYKVFIVDEVHMLSVPAFNALLKVLEEPPKHVIFILCTTEVHKIPSTIISRCQRFDFQKISVAEIVKKLQDISAKEGVKIEKKVLESIARHSEGHMRDAESLFGQIIAIGGKEITPEEADLVIPRSDLSEAIRLVSHLAKKDAGSAIGLVNKMVDEGVSLKRFITDVLELLRKIMIGKLNPSLSEKLGLDLGETLELEVSKISSSISLEDIIRIIESLDKARNEIRESFIQQMPVEIAIASLSLPSGPEAGPGRPSFASPPKTTPQKPAAKPAESANPQKIDGPALVSLEEVSSKWGEVLVKVKKYNHSLSFILRVCEPRKVEGNRLCVAFKYKFHKERMGDEAIRQIVNKILREVYGKNLLIEAEIDAGLNVKKEEVEEIRKEARQEIQEEEGGQAAVSKDEKAGVGSDAIENLLRTLGGKVVS